jgi:hypothetical protein
VGERSPQTIELPYNQDITVAQRFEAGGEAWPIVAAAGCAIIIDIVRHHPGGVQGDRKSVV